MNIYLCLFSSIIFFELPLILYKKLIHLCLSEVADVHVSNIPLFHLSLLPRHRRTRRTSETSGHSNNRTLFNRNDVPFSHSPLLTGNSKIQDHVTLILRRRFNYSSCSPKSQRTKILPHPSSTVNRLLCLPHVEINLASCRSPYLSDSPSRTDVPQQAGV